MKKLILFLFIPFISFAQTDVPTGARMIVTTVNFDSLTTDSARIVVLPSGVALEEIWIAVDSTITGSAGDSIKIGITGERPIHPFRFADLAYDSIAQGGKMRLSHLVHRSFSGGAKYTHNSTVSVTTGDAEVFSEVYGLQLFPYNDFDTTAFGALKVRPYRDGYYNCYMGISFQSSKNNVTARGEVFINGAGYDYLAFERTISTATQTGAASASGGVYLAEGDTIRMGLSSTANATIFLLSDAQLTMYRVTPLDPYTTDAEREIWLYTRATGGQVRVFVKYRELL